MEKLNCESVKNLMKQKRRKTIYTIQIPVEKDGKMFVGVNSDLLFSFNSFVGSYRQNINLLRDVNYFKK